jgi:LPS-assembly protein
MTRGALVAPLAVVAALASAQAWVASASRALVNRARAEGVLVHAPQVRPGEAGIAPVHRAPLPRPIAPGAEWFQLHEAREVRREGDAVEAAGGVRFGFRGYEVRAEYARGDLRTEEFHLRGNVEVRGQDQKITGAEVSVDFRHDRAAFTDGSAVLGPGLVRGNLRSDIFLRAEHGSGTERYVVTGPCELTTCDLEVPHFHLSARSAEVRPGRRAILRDAAIKVLGRRLLSVPYLSIPLHDFAERYIPEVGQSPDEGYFVKTRWPTELRRGVVMDTRVDFMTKLGGGLGADVDYELGTARGLLRVYGVTGGTGKFMSSLNHRQRVAGGDLVVDGLIQNHDYRTAPGVRSSSLRTIFTPGWTGGATRLTYHRMDSRSPGFATTSQSFGLTDNRRLGRRTATTLTANYVSSEAGAVRREQVDVAFRGSHEFRAATASLEYQRTIPVGDIQGFFGASDRTPVLSLASDSRRLFGDRAGGRMPFRAALSWGELKDTLRRRPIGRTEFDLDFQPPRRRAAGFHWDGRFRQGIYSDGTAQYVISTSLGYTVRLGHDTEAAVRHTYLRPYGYTPLAIDRTGETNVAAVSASFRPIRSLKLSGETAYDLLRLQRREPAWQSINLRGEWRPDQRFQFRAMANYDSARERWTNVRGDLGWEVAGGFVSAGFRYDAQRHVWGSVNLMAEGLRWGRLTTSVLLSYNGFTRNFEARHFSFIYDLHCAEAILQIIDNPVGFRRGTEIGFFIRLKALPFVTPFGAGRRGQAIGTGTGMGF